MVFNSFEFAVFLALCLAPYFALQWAGWTRAQNRFLLLASYAFYAAWDWRFCFLIALSTVVDFHVARAISNTEDSRRRATLLGASLALNLGALGFFKYAGFFAEGFRGLFLWFGIDVPDLVLEVVLPVGISFYTFQTLSYTIDVYRRELTPTSNFWAFALFVAFFPQLVAGPIERASRLLPQITQSRAVTWEGFNSGCWLIFWGLFKKVVIADNLSKMVDMVYASGSQPTSAELVLATYAFTFQIYCDFSGYTDMARGIARLMGFNLMLNFRLPFFAQNPADLWRRWHISLSSWMRDYLYISLGGNRSSGWMTLRNLALTMVLSGLWHGAAMPFVLWGAYHAVLLIAHRQCSPWFTRRHALLGGPHWLPRGMKIFVMFHLTCIGFMIFRAENVEAIAGFVSLLAGPFDAGVATGWLLPMGVLILPLLAMQLAQARSGDLEVVLRWPRVVRVGVYLALGFMIVLLGEDGGQPFIYFQF